MNMYERIKAECAKRGISIASLEVELEFPRSSICKWDKNIPSILKVKQVADKLGVAVDELIQTGAERPTASKE